MKKIILALCMAMTITCNLAFAGGTGGPRMPPIAEPEISLMERIEPRFRS